ncbi:MAG: NAD(P)/FAD-dependent oxidoreductase [Hyphomonadaceae bacterium]|nr:NAD(P)/FAD-dependent oxidoreductase [Hyphomonadaceae bacterium]
MKTYDAVIIGAGHNGLVCAFYLAKAGLRVRVVERRGVVGGAAVTESFAPGFRNSTASYTVSLLNPKIIADMRLAAHGLRVVNRPIANFLPLDERRFLKVGGGLARTQAEVAKYSARDAERLPAYYTMLEAVADLLRAIAVKTPPGLRGEAFDLLRMIDQGAAAAKLSPAQRRDALALFTRSASEILDHWFESDPIKAAFGFDAVVGNFTSPDAPGSAYVLLHHVFGEANGEKGAWGHAIGGMGAITQAMAMACAERGVEIVTDSPVARVHVSDGMAVGVRLEDGKDVYARAVICNATPQHLFGALIDPAALTAETRERMGTYKSGSATLRMNVALDRLPRFSCLPEPGEHLQSGIIIAPSLAYMDRAFSEAKSTGWSRAPIVEMLIPSTIDETLAPEGKHVASLFCQHFAPRLPERSWDDAREEAADLVIDTVDALAPGFKASVIARSALSPLDLERTFGLTNGDIMHGRMSLDQLWAARPMLGHGDYRMPIKRLYLCGAGAHPGGGVSGLPGMNAAREVARDLRFRFGA